MGGIVLVSSCLCHERILQLPAEIQCTITKLLTFVLFRKRPGCKNGENHQVLLLVS